MTHGTKRFIMKVLEHKDATISLIEFKGKQYISIKNGQLAIAIPV